MVLITKPRIKDGYIRIITSTYNNLKFNKKHEYFKLTNTFHDYNCFNFLQHAEQQERWCISDHQPEMWPHNILLQSFSSPAETSPHGSCCPQNGGCKRTTQKLGRWNTPAVTIWPYYAPAVTLKYFSPGPTARQLQHWSSLFRNDFVFSLLSAITTLECHKMLPTKF